MNLCLDSDFWCELFSWTYLTNLALMCFLFECVFPVCPWTEDIDCVIVLLALAASRLKSRLTFLLARATECLRKWCLVSSDMILLLILKRLLGECVWGVSSIVGYNRGSFIEIHPSSKA